MSSSFLCLPVQLEPGLEVEQVLHPPRLAAQIVVVKHVHTLRPEHPQVQRVVVLLDLVLVMDDLTGFESASQMPLGYGAVNVVSPSRLGIAALGVTAHVRPRTRCHRCSS